MPKATKATKPPKTPKALVKVSIPRGGNFEVAIDIEDGSNGFDLVEAVRGENGRVEIEEHCEEQVREKLTFKVVNLADIVKAGKAQAKAQDAAADSSDDA